MGQFGGEKMNEWSFDSEWGIPRTIAFDPGRRLMVD
jgi:hypothetical protein